jgi:hypothetical protein
VQRNSEANWVLGANAESWTQRATLEPKVIGPSPIGRTKSHNTLQRYPYGKGVRGTVVVPVVQALP